MRIFILCGESSGDQLGGLLATSLRSLIPDIILGGWGGIHMANAGVQISYKTDNLGYMGFWEVGKRLLSIRRLLQRCKDDIREFNPDKIVFIDFGGFNLRMAKWSYLNGIQTIYFNPPKVWASRSGRTILLKKYLDLIIVNLPFEKTFLERQGLSNVHFFGHPLVEKINNWQLVNKREETEVNKESPLVALLPGSRKQEVKYILPILVEFMKRQPQYRFEISCAPALDTAWMRKIVDQDDTLAVSLTTDTYSLLDRADYGIIASGTASLEAALFELPHLVVYRMNWINYQIARRLIKVKFISLINLLLKRSVVAELIQNDLTTIRISEELHLLQQKKNREQLESDYSNIRQILGKNYVLQNISKAIIEL